MTLPSLIWGSPQWMAAALVLWASRAPRSCGAMPATQARRGVRVGAAILKALGFAVACAQLARAAPDRHAAAAAAPMRS